MHKYYTLQFYHEYYALVFCFFCQEQTMHRFVFSWYPLIFYVGFEGTEIKLKSNSLIIEFQFSTRSLTSLERIKHLNAQGQTF